MQGEIRQRRLERTLCQRKGTAMGDEASSANPTGIELFTERLVLRPWLVSDADDLYEYAKEPAVASPCGFPVHTSPIDSREVIQNVLAVPECYAVCLRQNRRAIGCIGLTIGRASRFGLPDDEAELGYWIGVPFWGQGLTTEASRRLIRHGFDDLGLARIWCGYFEGNGRSRRVMEKCGFSYDHTNKDILWKLTGQTCTQHVMLLERRAWKESTDEG